jgi:hypothetical protein
MGTHDVNDTETVKFPGSTIIFDRIAGQTSERIVELSNIPNRANDNSVDASIGFRYAPSDRLAMLANVLVPLNDGGLRSSFVPTVGFSLNY